MEVYGLEAVQAKLQSASYFLKLLVHERAVVLFDEYLQHRDVVIAGLHYQDDSGGNALAGTISPGRIDFRHHRDFSDGRVRIIASQLLAHPALQFARGFQVFYQGRILIGGT